MASRSLVLLVKAIDKATSTLKGIKGEVSGLGDAAATSAQDMQPLGVGLAAVGAAGVALIGTAAMTAARVEVLGTVLDTVGENAGYSAEQLAVFEAGLKGQGIVTSAAREGLIRLMQAQLDLTGATGLATVAQDAATFSSKTSSDAYMDLITVIQTGRSVMATNLGLAVNFNLAYQEMAAQLGKTVGELTAAEKMQARFNDVLRSGTLIEGAYDAAMGDVGKKLTSMPRLLEDAAAGLGQAYLPAMEDAVDVTSDLLKWFIALEPEQKAVAAEFLGLGTAVTVFGGAVILALPHLLAVGGAIKVVLASAAFAAGAPLVGLAVAMYAVIKAAQWMPESMKRASDSITLTGTEAVWFDGVGAQLISRMELAYGAGYKLADGWQGHLLPSLVEARTLTDGWATDLDFLVEQSDAARRAEKKLAAAIRDLNVQQNILTISMSGPVAQANEDYLTQREELNQKIAEGEAELANLQSRHGRVYSSAQELTIAEWKHAQAVEHLGEMHAVLAENTDPGKQLEIAAAIAKAEIAIGKSDEAIRRASGGVTDYGEDISGIQGDLAGWRGELDQLAKAHEESIARIAHGIMMTHLGIDGLSAADLQLGLDFARTNDLIDESTYSMSTDIIDYLEDCRKNGYEPNERAIQAIMDRTVESGQVTAEIEEARRDQIVRSSLLQRADLEETLTTKTTADEEWKKSTTSAHQHERAEWKASLELGTQPFDSDLKEIIEDTGKMERKFSGVGEHIATEMNKSHPGLAETGGILGSILGTVRAISGEHRITFTTHYDEGVPPAGTPRGPEEYQHGTPYVPSTGWAYLHEGEAVLTREENRRRGEGGRRVVVNNYFGRESVRTDEDIQLIIEQIQQSTELQGLRDRIG